MATKKGCSLSSLETLMLFYEASGSERVASDEEGAQYWGLMSMIPMDSLIPPQDQT
jgi:hypothetical protein